MQADPVPMLFPRLLQARFAGLPESVRTLHLRQGTAVYHGRVDVMRGRSLLSRLCGWATGLPPTGQASIRVEIVATPTHECWTRHVQGHAMRSRLWAADGLLCERLGLVTFGFRLDVDDGRLSWSVARARVLGVPLPARAFAAVGAAESERDGRYHFDVTASLPLAGPLVRYRGWLRVP